ncbi:CLUMA_CG020637, isoform A [Clunio marinus]|uniref:CLUMA_CG020637, isoform A n=1 Tax=Clunio marinus TaxID=568069 RepID=A0A1J1J5K0_9DIPT|nr:CLUMA_CG020637, isoform A [Clunio marinus]
MQSLRPSKLGSLPKEIEFLFLVEVQKSHLPTNGQTSKHACQTSVQSCPHKNALITFWVPDRVRQHFHSIIQVKNCSN